MVVVLCSRTGPSELAAGDIAELGGSSPPVKGGRLGAPTDGPTAGGGCSFAGGSTRPAPGIARIVLLLFGLARRRTFPGRL